MRDGSTWAASRRARSTSTAPFSASRTALVAGVFSAVAESPIGFHILRCDRIEPGHTLTLNQSRDRIRSHLGDQRRRICQKSWINGLRQKEAA